MESIVRKLSEIEAAAIAVVEHAEEQKAQLDQEMEKKRNVFDAQLEEETKAKIQAIQEKLEHEMSSVLADQSNASNSSIDAIEKEYNANHTEYAQTILQRIIEV